jgi:hypothetical protein
VEAGVENGDLLLGARHQAQKFTIEPTKVVKQEEGEVCDMCSA